MRITHTVAGVAAGAVLALAAPAVAFAQDLPDPPRPPLVQLCAATDIDAVDDLLAQIATEDAVQALGPLVTIAVPDDPRGARVKADVQLDDVRDALGCDDATTTPTPTPEPTSPAPTGTAPLPDTGGDSGGDVDVPGFSQLDDVPTGAAETGAGPA